jgi:ferredoxin
MMEKYNEAYMVPNPMMPGQRVSFDPEVCTGCNTCIDSCPSGVLVPNPEKGKPPIVLYPDECWVCGCCVGDCPVPGANMVIHPMNMRMGWMRKDTGENFRIGMKNPPPPNKKPAFD